MGLPSYPVKKFREYAQQVRDLLDGNDILHTDDVTGRETWVRLIHPDHPDFYNIKDHIPIYLAANGPRATAVVGEVGDGFRHLRYRALARLRLPDHRERRPHRRSPDREALHRRTGRRLRARRGRGHHVRSRHSPRRRSRGRLQPHALGSPNTAAGAATSRAPTPTPQPSTTSTSPSTPKSADDRSTGSTSTSTRATTAISRRARPASSPRDRLEDMIIGTPDQIIEKSEQAQSSGVDHLAMTALGPAPPPTT